MVSETSQRVSTEFRPADVLVVFGMMPGLALGPVDTATVPLLARIVSP